MGIESKIAHKYLDGLTGIEIGAGAHNPFGLKTLNVDYTSDYTNYQEEQVKLCGMYARVDIVAKGDNIPLRDKSVDFVVSSHVVEHFLNPVKAIKEWERVARKYIFMIVPHKERTFDKVRPLTDVNFIIHQYDVNAENDVDCHHHTYTPENFSKLMEWMGYDYEITDPDDKVGNGFIVIVKL